MNIRSLGMNCDEDYIFTILILFRKFTTNELSLTRRDHKNGIYELKILCMLVTMFLEVPGDPSTLQIMITDRKNTVETFNYQRCEILMERENLTCEKIWNILTNL